MTQEEARDVLAGYVKACKEDDLFTLETCYSYEQVIEAMSMGAESLTRELEENKKMTKEQKEKLAHSAANDWCNCYKCDGVVNTTGLRCDKPVAPCMAWRDAYRGAMIALGKLEDER